MNDTPYTLGIEEEYLLVDRETGALAEAPEDLMEACSAKLEGQVSPEFLQCQIEIGTRVCKTIGEAREDLRNLRATVSDCAAEFGLTPIAASCHPFRGLEKAAPHRQGPLQPAGQGPGRGRTAHADLRDAHACGPA
jgi:carboxylate-amine ligase